MLPRVLIGCALWLIPAMSLSAEDAPPETSIQIYRVGDLVSYNTLNQAVAWSHISPEAWQAEHAETIESLERLTSLVRSLCCTKPTAVESHRETLSLIVRHTADGHREIDQLLKALRIGNEPSIRLTCQPICDPSGSHLKSLPEEQRKRAEELLMRKTLTPDEAREARELLAEPDYAQIEQTVQLVAGRKASWGHYERPATATARIVPGKRSIQLRVDYVVDDPGDTLPVASQVFDIQERFSAISHHTCDGGTLVWLISPSIIEPAVAGNAGARTTATK